MSIDAEGKILVAGEYDDQAIVFCLTDVDASIRPSLLMVRQLIDSNLTVGVATHITTDADGRVIVTGAGGDGGLIVPAAICARRVVAGQRPFLQPTPNPAGSAGTLSVSDAEPSDDTYTLLDDAGGLFTLDGAIVRTTGPSIVGRRFALHSRLGPVNGTQIDREFTVDVRTAFTVPRPVNVIDVDATGNGVARRRGGFAVGLTVQATDPETPRN